VIVAGFVFDRLGCYVVMGRKVLIVNSLLVEQGPINMDHPLRCQAFDQDKLCDQPATPITVQPCRLKIQVYLCDQHQQRILQNQRELIKRL